jgi:hypothetical protein
VHYGFSNEEERAMSKPILTVCADMQPYEATLRRRCNGAGEWDTIHVYAPHLRALLAQRHAARLALNKRLLEAVDEAVNGGML